MADREEKYRNRMEKCMTEFKGFYPETIDFLWGIRFNNNREWFAEHKEEYQKYLFEPMKALAASVGEAFMGEDGTKLHLSRIYRDMRMHPTTFYKESLWFCIRRPGASWLEQPGLCFEIRPEGYRFGFLLIHPKAATMELLRIKMADHSEEFLKIVKQAEKESGLKLTGDTYARQKPCPKEELKPYFSMKNFFAMADFEPDDLLYSPELADKVRKTLLAWKPLFDFCHNL